MTLFEAIFGPRPQPPKKIRLSWRCEAGHDHVEIRDFDQGMGLAYYLLSMGQSHIFIENEADAQDRVMHETERELGTPLNAQSIDELIKKVTRG